MPLDKSGTKASVGPNVAAEISSGKPRKQATAIALSVARAHGAKIPPPPARRKYRTGNNLPRMPGGPTGPGGMGSMSNM